MVKVKESATRIFLEGHPKELTTIIESLRFRPEDYWRSEAYQLYKISKGERGWDGYFYPVKRIPQEKTKALALRGQLQAVKDVCFNQRIELDLGECLTSPFNGITTDDIPDDAIRAPFTLDVGQRRCVASWLDRGNGVHHITVAGGKTAMFATAASLILKRFPKARLLYFTPTERLVRQVYGELKKFLPKVDISQYGGGKKDRTGKQIVVATNAILWRNFKELKSVGFFRSFMGVLYDETQYCAAPSQEKVLMEIPAYFRFGASDSKREADPVRFNKIVGLIGPWLETIETHELIEVGRAAKPTIYIVDIPEWKDKFKDVDHAAPKDSDAWVLMEGQWKRGVYLGPVFEAEHGKDDDPEATKVQVQNMHRILLEGEELQLNSRWCLLDRLYDRAIIRFKERNNLIGDWAAHYSAQGFPTLVVATRTLHVYILESVIGEKIGHDKVKVLFSEHSSKERDQVFEWFKKSKGGVLITPLVQVGVSINEIRGGVIADPIADFERAKQVIGRFIRKKEDDNRCEITFFMDRQHPTLRGNCIRLFKHLEMVRGYTFYHPLRGPDTISLSTKFEASTL